jgi:acyl-CoA reductase-like NAD-dependent aldehyde dehydrogenase
LAARRNLPVYLASWKIAPALAMGNTVVLKPSEITPRTASMIAEICSEVGLPAGVFNIVQGYGWDAGQALCEHPDVNLISFTGGTVTGRKVAATAAPMFKKLSLELGGKNATIVMADCDFDLTVKGAVRAAFTNQGQVCLAGSRIFIEDSICQCAHRTHHCISVSVAAVVSGSGWALSHTVPLSLSHSPSLTPVRLQTTNLLPPCWRRSNW